MGNSRQILHCRELSVALVQRYVTLAAVLRFVTDYIGYTVANQGFR
ncbi:hypothetical protein [Microbulbifer spongiae]|uniref:Uncharacterized protein n=1 Tax=Microbulbifer spongiae TaxID=2944933 RepID=A0ABY9EA94_9GAMM|nr:hypothetical protein [Microbulbifer sp. MI-G]WKD49948.1 hypothetical protein M8T91_00525 [Microbulbifer sp. MI-G]